jgi:hypothetical protein
MIEQGSLSILRAKTENEVTSAVVIGQPEKISFLFCMYYDIISKTNLCEQAY